METFSQGDVVQLKSGGPKMTIAKLSENQAECVWFVSDEQRSSWFDLVLLKSGERSTAAESKPRLQRQY